MFNIYIMIFKLAAGRKCDGGVHEFGWTTTAWPDHFVANYSFGISFLEKLFFKFMTLPPSF